MNSLGLFISWLRVCWITGLCWIVPIFSQRFHKQCGRRCKVIREHTLCRDWRKLNFGMWFPPSPFLHFYNLIPFHFRFGLWHVLGRRHILLLSFYELLLMWSNRHQQDSLVSCIVGLLLQHQGLYTNRSYFVCVCVCALAGVFSCIALRILASEETACFILLHRSVCLRVKLTKFYPCTRVLRLCTWVPT